MQEAQKAKYEFMSAGGTVGGGSDWEAPSRAYFVSLAKGLVALAEAIDVLNAKVDKLSPSQNPTSPVLGAMAKASLAGLSRR